MPMVPQKRGVSRSRYEKMVKAALVAHNNKVTAENLEIAWLNADSAMHKRDDGYGVKKPKPFMTEEDAFHSRKRECSRLRFRIYRELHNAGFSLPSIGAAANVDHTTALSGIRKINEVEPLVEGSTADAALGKNVNPAEAASRASSLSQPLASIEIDMTAVAA